MPDRPLDPVPMRPLACRSAALGLILLAGCAPTSSRVESSPDRVLMTDAAGQVMRRSALSESGVTTFDAPIAVVWPILAAAYAQVGVEANFSDRATWRYGARQFVFPRSLNGDRVAQHFSCGNSMTGALVDNGTVRADVVTTLLATPEGKTVATTQMNGLLRRNEGTSTDPIVCSGTGRLPELLRAEITRRLAAAR